MRTLFWRIFASFWLAIALVAGLSLLLGHALNQDAWILARHPGVRDLASRWIERYEQRGPQAAQE
ncbi:two-component sensor histidine kinase, partial [Pseudomonas sp. MOB-449]|nr:two-component sensor histidine kinase [Pseudomonas sp. MOB-449]